MRQVFVAGNWKMNGSCQQVQQILLGVKNRFSQLKGTIVVCPPFVYLDQARQILADSPIQLGAQNISEQKSGAFTGEISGVMLTELGADYTIVGHSERRILYLEDNRSVAHKFSAAQACGLIPILCVGETLQERDNDETFAVVEKQIRGVIEHCGVDALANSVLAYEPIWAIGSTGRTASPEQAQAVHSFIRALIGRENTQLAKNLQIIYGGSVNANNAQALFAMPDIDGGLVGGASLNMDQFFVICQLAT